jgi:hypothetical protein
MAETKPRQPPSTHTQTPLAGPAQQLWERWRQGQQPDVHEFLTQAGALARTQLLAVLRVDQRERWQRGELILVETYFDRHPKLLDDEEAALDLIFGEVLLREEQNQAPALEEYQRRFPQFKDQLQCQFALHGALASLSSAAPPDQVTVRGEGQRDEPPALTQRLDGPSPVTELLTMPGYDILGEIGRGGMGVVYRAFDHKSRQTVALKTLQHAEPAALYRFKQEFRALADVVHPNLVSLHDLLSDGCQWCFTMEFVEGDNFLNHVRPGADAEQADVIAAPLQLMRLRPALRQLAEGIAALHAAGKLHRDIKPSNVLVTRTGRVVLLDFGLATGIEAGCGRQSTEHHIVGTIPYMAPEQGATTTVSAASDWYSVGVMLYEALTGRLPFLGNPLRVLMDKQMFEPPPPRELAPDVPDDLNALCVELLRRYPESRPPGVEVLRRLGSAPESRRVESGGSQGQAPLIGRERHVAVLRDAFETMKRGRAVALFVHGRSGVGKSTLVQRFVDALDASGEAVVLAGRCYERESVPYKALDTLVDALSRYLRRLPRLEVQALLPRDVLPLARLFPVLRRIEAVAEAPRRGADIPDMYELRRRAFTALRELLARMGDRKALVLHIDDLQWGDVDSAVLLADLLRPPDPPVLLFLGCYRDEDEASSPFLRVLKEAPGHVEALDRRALAVDALAPEETRSLALQLLAPGGGGVGRPAPSAKTSEVSETSEVSRADRATAYAEAIVRESSGNPFFVQELVQYIQAGAWHETGAAAGDVTLEKVLWARIVRLPEEARRLLETVAVAGRPLGQAEACQAAELGGQERVALALLRAGRLIRSRGMAEHDEIETYHDRIRETVTERLSPARLQNRHRRLALALEASGHADPEVLAVHFQGAWDVERAAEYYAVAAGRAAEALAFDRAARLYRLAIELRPVEGDEERALRVKLGDALTNAGRGAEAARAYLQAAETQSPAHGGRVADALDLKRKAAEQLLRSGQIDEGSTVLRGLLDRLNMRMAATPGRALLSLLLRRAWIRWRGLGYKERDASQISAEELIKIDTCLAVAVGLSRVDTIRGADFQARHLLLALRSGERYRVAAALCLEAAFCAIRGGRTRQRTATLIEQARGLAERVHYAPLIGATLWSKGFAAYMQGRWRDGRDGCQEATKFLRERCTGVTWELDTAQFFTLLCRYWLGELKELSERLPAILADVQERGDLYAEVDLRTRVACITHLAADAVEQARQEGDQAIARWSQQGFHGQHYNHFVGQMHIALYGGDGAAAWRLLEERWPVITRSLIQRVQYVRVEALHLRGRAALAAAACGSASGGHSRYRPDSYLKIVDGCARRIEQEKMPWAEPLARLLRGGAAYLRCDRDAAVARLVEAEAGFTSAEMALYAAAARLRRGQLLGDAGRDLVATADEWMAGQRICNPAAMTRMCAPGFPDGN